MPHTQESNESLVSKDRGFVDRGPEGLEIRIEPTVIDPEEGGES